jgi:cytochrome c-type biogenesis protein CcmH/NrfF
MALAIAVQVRSAKGAEDLITEVDGVQKNKIKPITKSLRCHSLQENNSPRTYHRSFHVLRI